MMKNKKINVVLNVFIIMIVLSIVLYFSLKENFQEIVQCILNMKLWYLVIAIVILIVYRTLIGISSYIVTRSNGCKFKLLKSIQINFIILFFHGITPFAGGGQPMEIYYLHNEKVSKTRATNITVQNFILYQTALLLLELFAIIYNRIFNLFPSSSLIRNLVLIGMLINFLVWLVSFLLGFGKRFNKFILKTGVKLLGKLKIVKNVSETREKVSDWINTFHDNALELKNKKMLVACSLLLNVIAIVLLYSIPYFIIIGMGITNISMIATIVTITYIMVIGSIIPIPGGTGGLEYGFMYFFGYLIGGEVLTAIMLIWRFVSYYLGVIIGAIALSFYRKKED